MLNVPGIVCELNWLFKASFESGLEVRQQPEDRSQVWTVDEPRSAWHDVMEALKRGEKLSTLILDHRGSHQAVGINFPELTFEIGETVFRMDEGHEVFNVRPVYCRRRSCLMSAEGGSAFGHNLIYRIGWQGNTAPTPGSPNIERIIEIPN